MEAQQKLDRMAQQLASHEQHFAAVTAAQEAAMSAMTKEIQEAAAAQEAVKADLTQQLQASEAAAKLAETELRDARQQLADVLTESTTRIAAKDAKCSALQQQLASSEQNVNSERAGTQAKQAQIARLTAQFEIQQAEAARQSEAQLKLIQQLQKSGQESEARLQDSEVQRQDSEARLQAWVDADGKEFETRQQASVALQAELAELTQHLSKAHESRHQLEGEVRVLRSSSSTDMQQAQVCFCTNFTQEPASQNALQPQNLLQFLHWLLLGTHMVQACAQQLPVLAIIVLLLLLLKGISKWSSAYSQYGVMKDNTDVC